MTWRTAYGPEREHIWVGAGDGSVVCGYDMDTKPSTDIAGNIQFYLQYSEDPSWCKECTADPMLQLLLLNLTSLDSVEDMSTTDWEDNFKG